MNNDLLKYINEFVKSFEKDHTFYLNGERLSFCEVDNIRVKLAIEGEDWDFLTNGEISEVSITATKLTITARSGREYTFIAKPKPKKEIISVIKNKLTSLFYKENNKEEIDEIIYLLDGLEQHQ